jgi:hypothetical protein
MISSSDFYQEYHGHRLDHLELLYSHLRHGGEGKDGIENNPIIFLAGDSSLDNKHWFREKSTALNGYETILTPPQSRQDIAYWMNYSLLSKQSQLSSKWSVINCAIEESTIGLRSCGKLLPQDKFISSHIQSQDILVLSVGGNDIALHPSFCTILNLLLLTCCTTQSCLENFSCGTAFSCDDPCHGCSTSCLSNCLAFPLGLGYFIHLFKTRIQTFLINLLSSQPHSTYPAHIYICMIYYLDETPGNSWAEPALTALQYNSNPKKLQLIIMKLFQLATQEIKILGTQVTGIPLFSILNGQDSKDYVERVEPSAIGGKKMGMFLVNEMMEELRGRKEAGVGGGGGGGKGSHDDERPTVIKMEEEQQQQFMQRK